MVNVKTSVFKSFVVEDEEQKELRLNEGDLVEFTIESTGEKKVGYVTLIKGKGQKTTLQIRTVKSEFEEIHSVNSMVDGSLKLFVKEEE